MGPFHCFIKVLKLFRFSADFISFGRPFQICDPIHDRLFDPNVVWLGLTWAKLFGFLNPILVGGANLPPPVDFV